ncbi:MAG: hypothetical protein ACKO26_19855, partial [Planctomycetota bacterium]
TSSIKLNKDLINGSSNSLVAIERAARTSANHHYFTGEVSGTNIVARIVYGNGSLSGTFTESRPSVGTANDGLVQGFSSAGFHAVMADGSAKNISLNVLPNVFNAVCNITTQASPSVLASWDD